ncbi:Fic family protein, partial [Phocaeicola plebeius]|uniref:Fic family protein n=1 Tax=Phocaeicola plebeius TaxID=310297 RepID=UPI0026EE6EFE
IHKRLFEGLYKHAGQIRNYNITKKEWVLDGDTVIYSDYEMIRPTLEYDFAQEKSTDYPATNAEQALQRIGKFISGVWQIHAFGEGNTRTIAVFLMKYLKTFGFKVDNDIFKKHSWYFRNALVRANYNNYTKGVSADAGFLDMFLRNMLFGENNPLSNREMHINFSQSAKKEESKSQNGTLDGTLNCTLDEMALLNFLKENPKATQSDIAAHIGKSERTVKRMTPSLIERGLLERINGKGDKGSWVVKTKDKD